jgi:Tfp pilus assembly protein FimT
MMPTACRRKPAFNGAIGNAGFTGVELLVVLAIAAVMITLAIPPMTNLLQGMRTQGEANKLAQGINLARSTALQTGLTTILCSSRSGTDCDGVDGSWQMGWLVFSDPAANQTFNANNLVHREPAFNSTDTLHSTPVMNSISVNRSGLITNLQPNTVFRADTNPLNPSATRCIAIQVMRRATVQSPSSSPESCQ